MTKDNKKKMVFVPVKIVVIRKTKDGIKTSGTISVRKRVPLARAGEGIFR
ncbi:hypothetical protein KKC45_00535 [Patescibacteria group bacterium]|nr:hypothetical protein [Patescibacteria group bacterium]